MFNWQFVQLCCNIEHETEIDFDKTCADKKIYKLYISVKQRGNIIAGITLLHINHHRM